MSRTIQKVFFAVDEILSAEYVGLKRQEKQLLILRFSCQMEKYAIHLSHVCFSGTFPHARDNCKMYFFKTKRLSFFTHEFLHDLPSHKNPLNKAIFLTNIIP